MTLIALSRGDVADYFETLVIVYAILILIRIVLSWFQRIPYNRYLDAVLTFVNDVTDPYLNLFRRFLPPLRLGPGALDLSPMLAIIVLYVVGGLVAALIRG